MKFNFVSALLGASITLGATLGFNGSEAIDNLAVNLVRPEFPLGHVRLFTPATGLRCGFYALIGSMEAQYPHLVPPTMDELDEILTVDMAAINDEFGITNSNQFSIDQLTAVLGIWGERRGLNIQLAVMLHGVGDIVIPNGLPGMPDTLWVHNDNSEARRISTTSHWSSIGPAAPAIEDTIVVGGLSSEPESSIELGRDASALTPEYEDSLFAGLSPVQHFIPGGESWMSDDDESCASLEREYSVLPAAPRSEDEFIFEFVHAKNRPTRSEVPSFQHGNDVRKPAPANAQPSRRAGSVDRDQRSPKRRRVEASPAPDERVPSTPAPNHGRSRDDEIPDSQETFISDESAAPPLDELEQARIQGWLSIAASRAASLMAERNLLHARHSGGQITDGDFEARRTIDETFVSRVQETVERIYIDSSDTIRFILNSSAARDWALAIEERTPRVVRDLVSQAEAPKAEQLRQLPRVRSTEFGVYACLLFGLDETVHHHLYVGSGTSDRGIKKRMRARNNTSAARDGLFGTLLTDDKPREPNWITLMLIPGSQAAEDPVDRTYYRILTLLAECVFHDLLASWIKRPVNRPSPWNCPEYSGRPIDWWGMNSGFPLDQSGIGSASWSTTIQKARKSKRDIEVYRAMSPDSKQRYIKSRAVAKRVREGWREIHRYRPEEDALLLKLRRDDGLEWKEVEKGFGKQFPVRPFRSLKSRYNSHLVNATSTAFSEEEDALLLELKREYQRWSDIHPRFQERFSGRTVFSLQNRWQRIGGGQGPRIAWTEEEDARLLQLRKEKQLTWDEIRGLLSEEFPAHNRTSKAIQRRHAKLIKK